MAELLAPNGQPSNLTPEQYKIVRSPEFKAWFGDWEKLALTKINDSGIDEISLKRLEDGVSKVVDSNGEPLVCRHYSQKPNKFNEFTKQKPNDTRNFISFAKEGFYFSTANKYSIEKIYNRSKKGLLYEVFLNIKNILDLGNYNAYDFTTKKAVNWKEFTFEMLQKYVIKGRVGSFDDYTEYNVNVNAFWIDEIDEKAKNKILKLGYKGVWGDKDKYADSISDEFYGTDQIVVFDSNQIKLADGTNTNFDGNNPDIRFDEGGEIKLKLDEFERPDPLKRMKKSGELKEKLLEKSREISNKNEYLNCDAFCHRMVDNKLFKDEFEIIHFDLDFDKNFESQYQSLIKVLNVGDIIAFGEKDNVRHYSIYLGKDDVIEVEMWGEKPRVFSLKDNLYNYENVAFIYREKKYKKGGRTIAQTPAPKKERIYGSEKNKPESSNDFYKKIDIRFENGGSIEENMKKLELQKLNEESQKNKINDLLTKAQIPYQYTISHKNGSSYWTINSRPYRVADHDKPKSMDVFERYKYGVNDFRSYKQFIDFIENNFDLTDLSKLEKKYKEDVKQNIKINSDGIYVTPDGGTWGDIDSALRYLWRYQLEKRNIYKKSSYLYELEEEERNSGYYSDGGRTIAQTPAPKKERIYGSEKNKPESSKDTKSAEKIEFNEKTLETIKNKVAEHNEKNPKKKVTLASAKAVVRRGMGAYSSSHRPTIKGGKPNSRVAWGLARLNAFLYKIINGKSKSGKYNQDDDLINELGYKVNKYEIGGIFQGTPYDFNAYSTEYIGTGEGNQAFGWGLYFTDVKDVARYYMSAGLYDDEQKIMLNGKSLSKYKIQQEVKDQLVGIVDTIFGEDKMIPTINSIKGYLVLEYDEENYPELKEIVELCNKTYDFIKDKKLSFIGNIYSVTLFKGKNPDEYDLLEWEQKPTETQISKIKNQAKEEGIDLSKLPFDLERYRDCNAIYNDLSYIISGVSHLYNRDSGKNCSEFLLRAGIDGIRYKAGTLSGFEDVDGYNYVIFDANDITIEGKEKYDEILAGKEKYADGGDVQAYEEAMGISQFDEGGEAKPKKVYVSIRLDNQIERDFPNYFWKYDEKTFEELQNGKLLGLVGVSTSPNNIAEWFIHRDCLIVMNYDEFMAINETETINYYDPYQLMKNDLYLFRRLYANVTRYGEQDNSINQTIVKLCEKILPEINLEMNISSGQKYSELYRISRFLDPYQTGAFTRWIEDNKMKIESPIDLTNAILDFNKLYDGYLGSGYENPVLTFDELLPIVEKGITNASKIYESEHEIVLINRELNIPKKSQLFFIAKDEVGQNRDSNRDELIQKYNLKELYKVYFVDRKEIQKYRDFWVKKEEEKFKNKIEKGREDLELKKEQVLDELLNYFLEKSISYIKNELEKEIIEYNESLDFYDETDDNSVEQNLFSIPLVVSLMNTYELIIKNIWKSFIQKKQVKNLDLYAFDMFYFNVESELKRYFENNKNELEKLNNYRNVRGSGSLDPYRFERLLLKTINDYEKLPELVDYKELAKMYLDKMGREIYRYYDKNDLKLVSQYKDGGETEEPTHFWGNEAGGALIYCSKTDRYLILLRSMGVSEPNTWGIISGKLDDEDITIKEAVYRESEEEIGYKLSNLVPTYIFEKPNFKFHNFVSIVNEEFEPKLNWENSDYKWVKLNELPENLHFGLKKLLENEDIPKLVKNNIMENEILVIDMNMYRYDTSVNFKNKEIPLKLNSPLNQVRFIEWVEDNNIDFEQWGDAGMDDVSWGYTFEVPLNNYIEYLKTEKYYTGGELKKGIKTEMEHKETIKKIKTGDYTIKESAELIAKDHLQENDKYYTHLIEMEKQFGEGGLTDKKEDFNVPTTESLIELVSKEREKYIKNLRKQGFKVVVGRNDGYYWNLESEKDGVSELAKNPSKRKVLEIIKNNPNVTKIGFQGTLLVADKVGEELEIVDDFAVILWEKDSMFFKEGLNFEFVYDNGKYINVIVNKNDTETYKDRKDDGNYVYFKSIDKKYNTISERRSKIEFLKEEFDNGEAFIVDKMENGGKVESINSKKGNIKLSLDEYMYSDDTDVELVPVSELVKFREFDRKKNPKYNKENSIDNINHLKFMFQKEGVKSPIIIEYSPEDNAVLIIEGNHRLNSAEDLGMEYLPARVVLKKYGKYSPEKLKNTIKVSGVKGDEYGYIPSNMKPSKIGIQGTKSLIFGDGGIIEGRLHSECGEDGCGRKFQVGENGHVIEAERDEAVIVADAFNDNQEYKIEGTPSEIASALNVMGGGKNFDKGATIEKDGEEIKMPEMQREAVDTDVDDIIDPSSIIINRRSMADEKEYEVTGTPKQIASAINSINGNGVVIEKGAEIKES